MPRPPRQIEPGAVHHVGHHVNFGRSLFASDRDRRGFLRLLRETVADHALQPLSWSLMGNHYHLLARDPEGALTAAMRQLNSQLARRCNLRDDTRGTVLWQRYFGVRVRSDRHLRAALRYIALNPVAAGFVERPEDWRWSSHAALCHRRPDPVVDRAALLELFGGAPAACAAWVEGGMTMPRALWVPPSRLPAPVLAEVRPSLAVLLADREPEEAAALARAWHYPLREVADALEVSTSTIDRWARGGKKAPAPLP